MVRKQGVHGAWLPGTMRNTKEQQGTIGHGRWFATYGM